MLRKFGVALALVAAFGLGMVACSDDDPPSGKDKDMKVEGDAPVRLDTGEPDSGKKDTFEWPDVGDPDNQVGDLWPSGDMYSGTPFGCTTDADCFGLKCCATPWGVKICSKTCN